MGDRHEPVVLVVPLLALLRRILGCSRKCHDELPSLLSLGGRD